MKFEWSQLKIPVTVTAGVFALRALLVLLDPNAAFGMSLGLAAFAYIFGTMLVSVALAGAVAWMLMHSRLSGHQLKATLAAGALMLSFPLHFAFLWAADADWNFSQRVVSKQIEYFCLTSFQRKRCVDAVNACPSCVLEIDRWKRDIMSGRLKEFRVNYSNESAHNQTR